MLFPEALYLLSPRDQQVTWLDPLAQQISNAAVAVAVDSGIIRAPIERALILLNTAARVEPGAGQTSNSLNVRLVPPTVGSGQIVLTQQNYTATATTFNLIWTGQIIIPAGWGIVATGNFSAAPANPNNTFLNVIGMLIPTGNIQRL